MQCSWLAWGLVLSMLSVKAEDHIPRLDAIRDNNAAFLRSGVDGTPPHLDEFVDNATLAAAYSGCGLCQETGQCDHAFHGQPGQFCIQLVSGAPCCCPRYAQCAASPYECRCRRVAPPHHYSDDGYHSRSCSGGWFGTFIFVVMLLLCCVCCCYLPKREAQQQDREENVVYAQPVGASQYGTCSGPYASAPMAYEPQYRESGGGGNAMAAGALGALGGLGVGAALGSAFGGHNNRSGDVGGISSNEYSFSGDTGGGDFGGDTGGGDFGGDGGYTFAGDS
ncbi:hypothetical protein PsorP6_007273 [Peronosclerospora sorghi]|uniref:Uncharacterized protein n=1 Tax=Peronosclerospora sorghi TaxID=230839 RepID=A0ACC0W7V9_9STRA|nr:hypothetical protein PsorP6_007273 [Peronosclerospora sorghi]